MSLETLALASAATAAVGAVVGGVAQVGEAKRSAAVAKSNAQIVEQQGQSEAELIRERARRLAATNRTNAGASGVDISSFADALADNDIESEMDAQTAIYNSKQQANNYRMQGRADRASVAPLAAGAALGAGSQALSGYTNWRTIDLLKTK